MALVERGAKVYYYESYRDGGRVTSRYVASGGLAEACAAIADSHRDQMDRLRRWHKKRMAALDRRERDAQGRLERVWAADRAAAGAIDGRLQAWFESVEAVFREAMAAAGCHQHKGSWRRRRMNSRERAERWFRVQYDLLAAFRRAASLERDGDVAARVLADLADRVAGGSPEVRAAVAGKVARVRVELEGPDPSPVERLLAERAAVCWLGAYEADLACQRFGVVAPPGLVTYFERRRDRAQRRFVSAVRAVAVLRKLAVPARRPRVDFGGLLEGVVARPRPGAKRERAGERVPGRLDGSAASEGRPAGQAYD
jgi:hypothetical protein